MLWGNRHPAPITGRLTAAFEFGADPPHMEEAGKVTIMRQKGRREKKLRAPLGTIVAQSSLDL